MTVDGPDMKSPCALEMEIVLTGVSHMCKSGRTAITIPIATPGKQRTMHSYDLDRDDDESSDSE